LFGIGGLDPRAVLGISTNLGVSYQWSVVSFFTDNWKLNSDNCFGDETDSTDVIKKLFSLGMIPPNRVNFIVANDNSATVASNDNDVVVARMAA